MAALKDTSSSLYQGAGEQSVANNLEEEDGFVDGSRDVMQGTMMTTEQVYGFMRGEVHETGQEVDDPFADSPTPIRPSVKKKAPNTTAISYWDMGGENHYEKITPRPKRSQQKEVKKKSSESDAWSAWDDM